jgi:hypothetical protein
MFFFERKNQKTLVPWRVGWWLALMPIRKSFLLLFFKKEGLASL